ncbi:MAG TPA: hypothetical protein RMH99_26770 [Sandaracinaceae bacterium LLY-WYZ-13_1]|nr:hypothetical protein [Sandaracinaceae bacterium LLY-WYZ-13_1]
MSDRALLALCLLALGGCAGDPGAAPDDPDAVGVVPGGKADGSDYTECELSSVVAWLNEGPTQDAIYEAGVHSWASQHLVEHRDGPDAVFGTEDDDLFDDVREVDDVYFVGPVAVRQLVAAVADRCEAPADPWALARDVHVARVTLPEELEAPASYDYPSAEGFRLGGTEFWQQWPDGHSPTYSYTEGTEAGRRCMQASAYRFEALMADPPEALVRLRDESSWGGAFFNWNDDYVESSWSDGSGPRLWAWRTGLIKWISQTNRDGSCYLPTRDLVERAAADCLDTAERNGDGEIQGCSAR